MFFTRNRVALLGVMMCWAWSSSATAQGPTLPEARPEARQALETLLGSLADGESVVQGRPSNPLPAQTRQRVVARAGETLDRVLRRTLSHLPIKDTVLRQAFVEVNPDVLTGSGAQRLKAGVELMVPNPEDVRRIMLRESGSSVAASAVKATPAADPPVPAPAPVAPAKSPSAEPPGPDMRDWVRYP